MLNAANKLPNRTNSEHVVCIRNIGIYHVKKYISSSTSVPKQKIEQRRQHFEAPKNVTHIKRYQNKVARLH